ncbi:MAG: TolC family protein [Desulfobacteraceae bacterium]|nr:TolC family protein [Desulfobacteraceae bacterium]
MKSKNVIVVCFAILLFPSLSGALETFSLEKSIEYGLEHSPRLQGGNITVRQGDMDIKNMRGRFLPSITTGYSHSKLFNEYISGTEDTDYVDQTNRTASLRLTQALFAGFEYKNRFDRAKLSKQYQEAQLRVQTLDLVRGIKAVFFDLLKKRYDVATITQRIKRLESDLAAARAFSEKKIAPYVYVLQAEADLEESKQSLWQTQTAIYKDSARLKSLLGGFHDRDGVEFDDDFEVPAYDPGENLDRCLDLALAARPEILLLDLQEDMARKDAAIAQGRYYPRVNLDLGLYDTDKDYEKNSKYRPDQHNTYWSAGVSVQMNLFDGGSAYYEKKRHLLEVNRISKEKQQVQMEIEEEVAVAFNSLAETRKRLVSVEKALAASRENYIRQRKRFNARIGTTSQVLDAQAMLARAESGKSQALLDCQMSLAELQHAMGQGKPISGQIKPDLDK